MKVLSLVGFSAVVLSAVACNSQENNSGVLSAESSTMRDGRYQLAVCVAANPNDTSFVTELRLNGVVRGGVLTEVDGELFGESPNEYAHASIAGKISKITKDAAGSYKLSLTAGTVHFSRESEGGERTLATSELKLDTKNHTLSTGTVIKSLEGCSFKNLKLLDDSLQK